MSDCPTCTFPQRETVDMVCQTCGWDYAQMEKPIWLDEYVAGRIRSAVRGIAPFVSVENLRWAATHEALSRSFIYDVLTGLADLIGSDDA